jgi:hydroxymethylbilane synthase
LSDAPVLRLGTRGSRLALAQSQSVADALGGAEIVAVRSTDSEPGDKERFVRGVEQALIPDEVRLAGVVPREDPRDAYVGAASSLSDLPAGARIGTSSLRRRSQLLAMRDDLDVVELRGNVDTRLGKLSDGDYDGIVVAAAGLRRLGRDGEIAFLFAVDEMTPAPGQGSLAIEARREDTKSAAEAARISDHDALVELTAERTAVVALDASCQTPVGVCARLEGGELSLEGYAGLPDGSEWVRDHVAGDGEQPAALGMALAERMISAGARDILERAEAMA